MLACPRLFMEWIVSKTHPMKSNASHHSRGFTLVELLVVITMIIVLVAISVTMVFRFRKSGEKAVAANNLRQVQAANMSYAIDNAGRFVPPTMMVDDVTYQWFENPDFVSQLKGESATYKTAGAAPDTGLDSSLLDPAVVRLKAAGYDSLGSSFGYVRPTEGDAVLQSRLIDPARSAVFITANVPFADEKSKIAYRHADKAIVCFYDGHAQFMSLAEIAKKTTSDIFWEPVLTAPTTP
jgi:prepilin-type processing-associated H-X9-DG protein